MGLFYSIVDSHPVNAVYLLLSTIFLLTITTHFAFRWYLEKIKNKKVKKTHKFILFFQIFAALELILLMLITSYRLERFFTYPWGVIEDNFIVIFIFSPLLWIALFFAAYLFFNTKVKQTLILFLITTAISGIVLYLNLLLFYNVFAKYFYYCEKSFVCLF